MEVKTAKRENGKVAPTTFRNSNNIISNLSEKVNSFNREKILEYVKKAYEKGFIVVPSQSNEKGIFKRPVWQGKVKEQLKVWNYETFLKATQKLEKFGFGIVAGKQPNNLYVNVLDFDCDKQDTEELSKLANALQEIAGEDEIKIKKLLNGQETTQSGRLHYFFLTTEPVVVNTKKIQHGQKIKDNGGFEPGFIELFTESNRFVALYEGILIDTEKEPVILRDLHIFTQEEVNTLLKEFGFLKEEKNKPAKEKKSEVVNFNGIIDFEKLKEVIKRGYKEGSRQNIIMYLSGFLKKSGIDYETAKDFVKEIATQMHDEEIESRLNAVEYTYKKANEDEIKGLSGLQEEGYSKDDILSCLLNNENTKKKKTSLNYKYSNNILTIEKNKKKISFYIPPCVESLLKEAAGKRLSGEDEYYFLLAIANIFKLNRLQTADNVKLKSEEFYLIIEELFNVRILNSKYIYTIEKEQELEKSFTFCYNKLTEKHCSENCTKREYCINKKTEIKEIVKDEKNNESEIKVKIADREYTLQSKYYARKQFKEFLATYNMLHATTIITNLIFANIPRTAKIVKKDKFFIENQFESLFIEHLYSMGAKRYSTFSIGLPKSKKLEDLYIFARKDDFEKLINEIAKKQKIELSPDKVKTLLSKLNFKEQPRKVKGISVRVVIIPLSYIKSQDEDLYIDMLENYMHSINDNNIIEQIKEELTKLRPQEQQEEIKEIDSDKLNELVKEIGTSGEIIEEEKQASNEMQNNSEPPKEEELIDIVEWASILRTQGFSDYEILQNAKERRFSEAKIRRLETFLAEVIDF
ncbi:hypothetical protein JCM14244_16860 [Venenivibrio stagnispumantis]|uniref:DNA primase/polymerase bifunctional N-terminal domain-containing protein n=1 Tax=Venenivibrio stagnispumantis TaxID=407998 RepID=A0AA45WQ79_9AQUI|nr:hypothetical protein [Venenivibrio stagnispumantis]MCW4574022.1 hypothetical protein [Venenivibrio stagnispumantis]SMP23423.1 hypothetical protein SAMN06264868_1296 [Venenivibrio stagnispumantis]